MHVTGMRKCSPRLSRDPVLPPARRSLRQISDRGSGGGLTDCVFPPADPGGRIPQGTLRPGSGD
eukprot:2351457-Rhodomonas_salina.1